MYQIFDIVIVLRFLSELIKQAGLIIFTNYFYKLIIFTNYYNYYKFSQFYTFSKIITKQVNNIQLK